MKKDPIISDSCLYSRLAQQDKPEYFMFSSEDMLYLIKDSDGMHNKHWRKISFLFSRRVTSKTWYNFVGPDNCFTTQIFKNVN